MANAGSESPREALRFCCKKEVHSMYPGLPGEISLFISLLAQRNEPKKGPPVSLVPPRAGFPEFMPRMGYSSMLPGLCKLG
jgi:hypothetical protein